MMTVDLYFGLMKYGDENMIAARIPNEVMMISGNLHLCKKNSRLVELKSLLWLFPLKKLVMSDLSLKSRQK